MTPRLLCLHAVSLSLLLLISGCENSESGGGQAVLSPDAGSPSGSSNEGDLVSDAATEAADNVVVESDTEEESPVADNSADQADESTDDVTESIGILSSDVSPRNDRVDAVPERETSADSENDTEVAELTLEDFGPGPAQKESEQSVESYEGEEEEDENAEPDYGAGEYDDPYGNPSGGYGDDEDSDGEILEGHSHFGEAFNEGPRQAAYLMEGTGHVNFPVTTSDPLAQKFMNQGVCQIHGFWYFEAERSFRQAAALDPDCAMAYWGMAMANIKNKKRARGFIAKAVDRRDYASKREQMYIDGFDEFVNPLPEASEGDIYGNYTRSYERIIYEFPDDLDAKAFHALTLWENDRHDVPVTSYVAIDSIIEQIFRKEPLHPAHHYRIHLWDHERPAMALSSCGLAGEAAPAIAHMWHMPGHIYSRLKRYQEASWQQEASARVDHAHMMRDRVMPDQIHNFAHNNEWLVRNLNNVGRVQDAIDLAKNMLELPRHPNYNVYSKRGSAYYGRRHLFATLANYEMWDELIRLTKTQYLEPTEYADGKAEQHRYLGKAYFAKGDATKGRQQIASLEQLRIDEQRRRQQSMHQAGLNAAKEQGVQPDGEMTEEQGAAIDAARRKAGAGFNRRIQTIGRMTTELWGLEAAHRGDYRQALSILKKEKAVSRITIARIQLQAEYYEEAEQTIREYVEKKEGEVLPLLHLVDIQWECGLEDEAAENFEKLRTLASFADLDNPAMDRLDRIARKLEYPDDWRNSYEFPADFENRPSLDSLGPFRWAPMPAPEWTLVNAEGESVSLSDYRGKPVVLIFYLGFGCLHCVEQLQAFSPKAQEFADAGYTLLAISTDDQAGLQKSVDGLSSKSFAFPLVSDSELNVFKEYRTYDDFESQALHGTFLIDGEGLVRWQDISYEPFMDPDFVLNEAKRILGKSSASEAQPDLFSAR